MADVMIKQEPEGGGAPEELPEILCNKIDVPINIEDDQNQKGYHVPSPVISKSDSHTNQTTNVSIVESSIICNGQVESDMQTVPSTFSAKKSKPAFVPASAVGCGDPICPSIGVAAAETVPDATIELKIESTGMLSEIDYMTPAKKLKVEGEEANSRTTSSSHIDTWRARTSDSKLKLNTKVRLVRIDKFIGNKNRCRLSQELCNLTSQMRGSDLDLNLKQEWFEDAPHEITEVQNSSLTSSTPPMPMPSLIPKLSSENSAEKMDTTLSENSQLPPKTKPHLVEMPRNLSREEVLEKAKEYCAISEDIKIEQLKPTSRFGRVIKPKKLDENFVPDLVPGERTPSPAAATPPLLNFGTCQPDVGEGKNLSKCSRRFSLNVAHVAPDVQTDQEGRNKGIISRRASDRGVSLCRNLQKQTDIEPRDEDTEDLHMPELTRYDNEPLPEVPEEVPPHNRKRNLSSMKRNKEKPPMPTISWEEEEQHNEGTNIQSHPSDPRQKAIAGHTSGRESSNDLQIPELQDTEAKKPTIAEKLDIPKTDTDSRPKVESEPFPRKVPSLKIQLGGVNRDEYKILPPSPLPPEEQTEIEAHCEKESVRVPVPLPSPSKEEEPAAKELKLEEKRSLRPRHKTDQGHQGEKKPVIPAPAEANPPPLTPTRTGQVTNGSKKKSVTGKLLKKYRQSCPANLTRLRPAIKTETETATSATMSSSVKTGVLPESKVEASGTSIDTKEVPENDSKKLATRLSLPIQDKEVQVRLRRLSPRLAKPRQAILTGKVNVFGEKADTSSAAAGVSTDKKHVHHPAMSNIKKPHVTGKINGEGINAAATEAIGPCTSESQRTQNNPKTKTVKLEGTNLNGTVVRPNGLSHEGFQPLEPVVCLESTLIKDHIYLVSQEGGSVKLMLFDGLIFQPIFHEHFSAAVKAQQAQAIQAETSTTENMEIETT